MKFLGFVSSIVAPIRTRRTHTKTTNDAFNTTMSASDKISFMNKFIKFISRDGLEPWWKTADQSKQYKEQRASFCPPFVFSSGEKAALQLCLNHVKPLRSPQPKLLDESIVFSLIKLFFFFVCELLLIDKPMVTSEPAVTSAQLLGLGSKLYHSNMQHMLN